MAHNSRKFASKQHKYSIFEIENIDDVNSNKLCQGINLFCQGVSFEDGNGLFPGTDKQIIESCKISGKEWLFKPLYIDLQNYA